VNIFIHKSSSFPKQKQSEWVHFQSEQTRIFQKHAKRGFQINVWVDTLELLSYTYSKSSFDI